jgi:hypothetical protein
MKLQDTKILKIEKEEKKNWEEKNRKEKKTIQTKQTGVRKEKMRHWKMKNDFSKKTRRRYKYLVEHIQDRVSDKTSNISRTGYG